MISSEKPLIRIKNVRKVYPMGDEKVIALASPPF